MSAKSETAGVVQSDAMYTLTAFKRQLGLTESALRAARRGGLRVRYVHKRGWIYGRDWIDYILGREIQSWAAGGAVVDGLEANVALYRDQEGEGRG